jgi:drug/metabolite transporter (DMT)-like permease
MTSDPRTLALTAVTLVAFAANSLLTRLALGDREIDAATFTAVRLVSGAVVLALLTRLQAGTWRPLSAGGALGPVSLIVYALPFSFAYLHIGAAVGALVLFGVVQLTMIGYGLWRGERPRWQTWLGLGLAAGGLLALALPNAARPDPLGLALMAMAGAAWGVYSLAGRTVSDPLASNARNFLWTSPVAIAVALGVGDPSATTTRGIALGLISGGVTSGLGYAIWYRTLSRLSVTQGSIVQLGVPVVAALGAVVLLDEQLTLLLTLAGSSVLAGVGLALIGRAAGGPRRHS